MSRDLIVFFILLLLLVSSFLNGSYELPWLLAFTGFGTLVLLREYREQQRVDFVNQLKSYRRELRNKGTVVVDNMLLRYDTVVTTYYLSIGLLFTDIIIPSRYRLYTGSEHPEAFIYSFCSLISGWWSFPAGPLLTVTSTQQNLRGGEKIPVAMLIDRILLQRAAYQESDYWNNTQVNGKKEKEVNFDYGSTGPGSASGKMLGKISSLPESLSLEKRIQELDNPTPKGLVIQNQISEKYSSMLKSLRQRKSQEKKPQPFQISESE